MIITTSSLRRDQLNGRPLECRGLPLTSKVVSFVDGQFMYKETVIEVPFLMVLTLLGPILDTRVIRHASQHGWLVAHVGKTPLTGADINIIVM